MLNKLLAVLIVVTGVFIYLNSPFSIFVGAAIVLTVLLVLVSE
jgi:hypothetical protein